MAKYATVRELKNQTTALIRDAEKGEPVVVTRRGKPALRKKILERHPQLAKESPKEARRKFDRITRKLRRSLPFKTWREMDRFIKGDRYGLAR